MQVVVGDDDDKTCNCNSSSKEVKEEASIRQDKSMQYESLSIVRIHNAIDSVCADAEDELTLRGRVPAVLTTNTKSTSLTSPWRIFRYDKNNKSNKTKEEGEDNRRNGNSSERQCECQCECQCQGNCFGIFFVERNDHAKANAESAKVEIGFVVLFYFAYSTWDGRVLYLDQILSVSTMPMTTTTTCSTPKEDNPQKQILSPPLSLSLLIRAILARIAVKLSCSRLNWQEQSRQQQLVHDEKVDVDCDGSGSVTATTDTLPPPERLQEWLTLYWPAEKMRQFLENDDNCNYGPHRRHDDDDEEEPGSLEAVTAHTNHNTATTHVQHHAANVMAKRIMASCNKLNRSNHSNSQNASSMSLSFRMANCSSSAIADADAADLNDIVRLVKGLALYEKEPDAVHIGAQQYAVDGTTTSSTDPQQQQQHTTVSSSNCTPFPPFFYCLLLSDTNYNHAPSPLPPRNSHGTTTSTATAAAEATTTTTNETSSSYTFGMAFFYIAHTSKTKLIHASIHNIPHDKDDNNNNHNHRQGNSDYDVDKDEIPIRPFLFLEDLFLEPPYRGKGAGTATMKLLARIALQSNCQCMVWQALDWNTPALQFYQNIGAQVQEGLVTYRYTTTTTTTTMQSSLQQAAAIPLHNLLAAEPAAIES